MVHFARFEGILVAEGVGGGMLDVAHVHKGKRAHSPTGLGHLSLLS